MTSRIDDLWARRREILPNASEDEIQEAFTFLMETVGHTGQAGPNDDPEALLRERGVGWRKERAHVTVNEIPVEEVSLKDERLESQEWMRYLPPTAEGVELAETLNDTLRTMQPHNAQAFILTELRGLRPAEAAEILGCSYEVVIVNAAAVRGALRAKLSR